jgi:hypothetical protein
MTPLFVSAPNVRRVIWITPLPRVAPYIAGMLLRRIIQKSTFPALLGMAATYALTAIVAILLAADGLARNSVFMPQLLDCPHSEASIRRFPGDQKISVPAFFRASVQGDELLGHRRYSVAGELTLGWVVDLWGDSGACLIGHKLGGHGPSGSTNISPSST